MKDPIDAAVEVLIGLPLSYAGRAADMLTLGFGEQKPREFRGRVSTVGEFAIHIQCPWRIVRDDSMLVGYHDMRYPPTGVSDDGFDPNEERTKRDELVELFMLHGEQGHLVRRATGAAMGDLRLDFADGCFLEITPDFATQSNANDLDDEYWRFFPTGELSKHFVVTAHGVAE